MNISAFSHTMDKSDKTLKPKHSVSQGSIPSKGVVNTQRKSIPMQQKNSSDKITVIHNLLTRIPFNNEERSLLDLLQNEPSFCETDLMDFQLSAYSHLGILGTITHEDLLKISWGISFYFHPPKNDHGTIGMFRDSTKQITKDNLASLASIFAAHCLKHYELIASNTKYITKSKKTLKKSNTLT
jgi:hypothetical protein